MYVVALIAGQSRGKRPEVGTGSAAVTDDVGVLLVVGMVEEVVDGVAEGVEEVVEERLR